MHLANFDSENPTAIGGYGIVGANGNDGGAHLERAGNRSNGGLRNLVTLGQLSQTDYDLINVQGSKYILADHPTIAGKKVAKFQP